MKGDVLDMVDAAIEQRCVCLCGAPITDRSPSAYFASEKCSLRWHAAQQPHPAAVTLRQMFERLDAAFNQWWIHFEAALRSAADQMAAATAAWPQPAPPPAPKTGPPDHHRPPKKIVPGGGWHNYARSQPRHRPHA